MHFMQQVVLKVEHFVNYHGHETGINMCNLDYPNWMSPELRCIRLPGHEQATTNSEIM